MPTVAGPSVLEQYVDFVPPPGFRKRINFLLSSVPRQYLVGLESIVLTNRLALAQTQQAQVLHGERGDYTVGEAKGVYYGATRSTAPFVLLLVDNICRLLPDWVYRVPVVFDLQISKTLFHEIGHHIDLTHQPASGSLEGNAALWHRKL